MYQKLGAVKQTEERFIGGQDNIVEKFFIKSLC